MVKVLAFFLALVVVDAKSKSKGGSCGASKTPCSGSGSYSKLIESLKGAAAQSSASKDLATTSLKDYSVNEIDAAKAYVSSGTCKLDSFKCAAAPKFKKEVRARASSPSVQSRVFPPRRSIAIN